MFKIYRMESLTKEQLQRIEENKRAAQRKRQEQLSKGLLRNQNTFNTAPALYTGPVQSNRLPVQFPQKLKSRYIGADSGTCYLISPLRFAIQMKYNENVVSVLKTIDNRVYDSSTLEWNFPLEQHGNVLQKVAAVQPKFTLEPLPKLVVATFLANEPDTNVDISKIDPVLLNSLLPFQVEGVKFGVSRKGLCMIADDMGLGKTIQALGISHYYVEKWPLLIVCPSSMRFPWEEAIQTFLPSVNPFQVTVMTTANDVFNEANVVITSYDLLKSCVDKFKQKKFKVLIFDESHFLKNMKSARTKSALQLTPWAQHIILLSGTPALSRPIELYPQIHAIAPTAFKNMHEFGCRYCDGKPGRFGWDYSGTSNATELELLLRRKFMLRRMKSEVLSQLPSKVRKVVVLQPRLVKSVLQQLQAFETQMEKQRGMEKRGTLMQYYCTTGTAKLPAIREYLEDKLETNNKMLIFAHHVAVLDGLCVLLVGKGIDYIRIDGSTSAEARTQLCDEFQSNPSTKVAVLSIRAANAGITLTSAQLVIFAELYWNPGELTQAEDRAHRIGQQDIVVVEYLIAKGTADDHIWKLVQSKLNVLNMVGLSKDSFKNANTEHLKDKDQPTLDTFVNTAISTSKQVMELEQPTSDIVSTTTLCNLNEDSVLAKEFAEDAFCGDDELFDCVDLDAIADSDSKRPKLS